MVDFSRALRKCILSDFSLTLSSGKKVASIEQHAAENYTELLEKAILKHVSDDSVFNIISENLDRFEKMRPDFEADQTDGIFDEDDNDNSSSITIDENDDLSHIVDQYFESGNDNNIKFTRPNAYQTAINQIMAIYENNSVPVNVSCVQKTVRSLFFSRAKLMNHERKLASEARKFDEQMDFGDMFGEMLNVPSSQLTSMDDSQLHSPANNIALAPASSSAAEKNLPEKSSKSAPCQSTCQKSLKSLMKPKPVMSTRSKSKGVASVVQSSPGVVNQISKVSKSSKAKRIPFNDVQNLHNSVSIATSKHVPVSAVAGRKSSHKLMRFESSNEEETIAEKPKQPEPVFKNCHHLTLIELQGLLNEMHEMDNLKHAKATFDKPPVTRRGQITEGDKTSSENDAGKSSHLDIDDRRCLAMCMTLQQEETRISILLVSYSFFFLNYILAYLLMHIFFIEFRLN